MLARILASFAVIVAAGVVKTVWFPVSMIGAANMAGGQFANSDAAAVTSVVGMGFFTGVTQWLTLITLALLVMIWWPAMKRGVNNVIKEMEE